METTDTTAEPPKSTPPKLNRKQRRAVEAADKLSRSLLQSLVNAVVRENSTSGPEIDRIFAICDNKWRQFCRNNDFKKYDYFSQLSYDTIKRLEAEEKRRRESKPKETL